MTPGLSASPHDRARLAAVQPADWVNPVPRPHYHLVVLGGGTAGLVAAAGAAGLGARVALVERALLGGDCLNTGCVPSKALLATARAAAAARRAVDLGVRLGAAVEVDFAAAMERMRALRAEIAPHDGAERFRALGVDVFLGEGRFVSSREIAVAGKAGSARLRFARALVATGGRPRVPAIPGLAEVGFRTSESIFDLSDLPPRLAVVGGGPIGCELAQAFARFGSRVTLVQRAARLLPRDEPEAAALLTQVLAEEGVDVRVACEVRRVERGERGRRLVLESASTDSAEPEAIEVDEILVATGRIPNFSGLGLEAAGIAATTSRIEVDDFLRTTNRRVFAAGDVAMAHQFTHLADATARIVVQNALFPFRRRASALVLPWCTFTDPEIAHVGLSRATAEQRGIEFAEVVVPFREVDRARLEGDERGFVQILVAARSGRILGATIAGPHAGELVSEVSVAMAGRVSLGALAGVIHPYPTHAEVLRRAGDAWNRRRLTPLVKGLLGRYLSWLR